MKGIHGDGSHVNNGKCGQGMIFCFIVLCSNGLENNHAHFSSHEDTIEKIFKDCFIWGNN